MGICDCDDAMGKTALFTTPHHLETGTNHHQTGPHSNSKRMISAQEGGFGSWLSATRGLCGSYYRITLHLVATHAARTTEHEDNGADNGDGNVTTVPALRAYL